MHLAFKGTPRAGRCKRGITRLSRVSAGGSQAFQLLKGCPVVTVEGSLIGRVEGLMVDAASHKPRYVMLDSHKRGTASIAIPWHSLYFDSTLAHLVFYTYDES